MKGCPEISGDIMVELDDGLKVDLVTFIENKSNYIWYKLHEKNRERTGSVSWRVL